nr:reverse transcriptase domain-containing protein [Tanacetum cinerariifolium]
MVWSRDGRQERGLVVGFDVDEVTVVDELVDGRGWWCSGGVGGNEMRCRNESHCALHSVSKVKDDSISPTRYYKDDSCWSADLESTTTEDIISNRSFMEVLVLNHYVLVKKVLRRRQNRKVPYDQRNNPPQHPRIIYSPFLDINHFRHFLVTLENLHPMDDEPMWAADRVVALTLGSAITIPKTANEFAIKADLGASINLMPYSLYAKLSLEILKPTKMSVRLADRSFQYPVRIAENMLVEVEQDFDALLDEGSKILHSIEGTLLDEEIFVGFDKFMAMTADKNSDSESYTEEPPFEKITINTNYKIKKSLKEPPTNLELKPLLYNLEYVFLEEPSFLPVIISS